MSSEDHRQQHTENEYEKPQCRGGRACRSLESGFACGEAWIERKPRRVSSFKKHEDDGSRRAVTQVTDERGQTEVRGFGRPR